MAQKWNLQDIVPPERQKKAPQKDTSVPIRTTAVRQAPQRMNEAVRPVQQLPQERVTTTSVGEHYTETDAVVSRLDITDGKLARIRRYILSAVLLAIIVGGGFITTILLSGAEITITPKIHTTTVQAVFDAKLKPGTTDLGYELLTLEEESERQVAAKGQEEVSERALGSITVYNAFSTTPQRLIKNTRFETKSGQIYRISDSIVVPGYKKDANGTAIAGSVVAQVFADGAGENYNIKEDMRLTVPGLKGTDQYELIYADAKKDSVQGGFEGKRFIIDEDELSTTRQKLQTELRDKLLARIATERPNGFIAYNPAITFTFESLPVVDAGGKAATVKERVRLHVPLFNEASFASFIAKSAVPSYGGESVRIKDPSTLTFSYEQGSLEDISTKENITFKLSGPVTVIWNYDEDALKKDIAGISEDSLPKVLAGYAGIDKAQAVIRPLWKSTFPLEVSEIEVHEVILGQ